MNVYSPEAVPGGSRDPDLPFFSNKTNSRGFRGSDPLISDETKPRASGVRPPLFKSWDRVCVASPPTQMLVGYIPHSPLDLRTCIHSTSLDRVAA